MKKASVILLVMTMLVGYSFAQNNKADKILKSLTEKTKSLESIKILFTYRLTNTDAGTNNEMKGMLITSGDKYRLELSGQLIISDGESVWTYIEDAEEVQINNSDDTESSINPRNILGNYTEQYKPKYKKEISINGRKMDVLELKQRKGDDDQKIYMTIDKTKNEIYSLKIIENKDIEITFQVDEFLSNIALRDGLFVFDPNDYPDVEINDMR